MNSGALALEAAGASEGPRTIWKMSVPPISRMFAPMNAGTNRASVQADRGGAIVTCGAKRPRSTASRHARAHAWHDAT